MSIRFTGRCLGTLLVARGSVRRFVLGAALATSVMLLLAAPMAQAANMDVVVWGQADLRWSSISLGGSSATMGSAGCAVTSVSMVANYYGSAKNPGQICQSLNANGGLTSQGWIVWGSVPSAAGGTIQYAGRIDYPNQPADMSKINAELDAGYPVIAAVKGYGHYIVITGHDGSTYYINDSGGPKIPYGRQGTFATWYGSPAANNIDGIFLYHGTPAQLVKYARHIVQQKGDKKKQKTSWYVSADLRRLWIPDIATFNALRATGAPKPDALTAGKLNVLVDQKGFWAAAGSTMTKQRTLRREMYLRSANGNYRLTLRADGDLVLSGPGGAVVWDAEVSGIDYLVFQKDGNLVGYRDGVSNAVWSSDTVGKNARRLVLRNDGVAAVLDASGKWLWSTKPDAPKVGEAFPICTAAGYQWGPEVSGNIVVWTDYRNGDPDIYGYDLAVRREFAVCTAPGEQYCGGVSGNTVVWADARNGEADFDIYAYDLSTHTETSICTAGGDQSSPAISGNTVVWEDDRNGDAHIFGYDLAAKREFPICTARGYQRSAAISGGIVVWDDRRSGDGDSGNIYGYDLVTRREFAICTATDNQFGPAISGDIVTWQEEFSHDYTYDVYGYDLAAKREFTICAGTAYRDGAGVSGNIVVWTDRRNVDDIYGYDLAAKREFPICEATNGQWSPAVSGNVVVWSDQRNGLGDDDIYGCVLTP